MDSIIELFQLLKEQNIELHIDPNKDAHGTKVMEIHLRRLHGGFGKQEYVHFIEDVPLDNRLNKFKQMLNNLSIAASGKWRRYRFETNATHDYRPLIFNAEFPWWCSGHGIGGDMNVSTSVIIAYLPPEEDLKKYWDDAFNIEFTEESEIVFTGRFPKPEWYKEKKSV